ncbi:MAG: hypothetical protein LAP38_27265 [Acidobacteriia bacterium]|nr:hypothetical protein [Terriglobia bacterium]
MTDFEDQLRRALERVEPSEDFAARVATRARRPAPWFQWRAWAAAGIAASLVMGALSFELDRRERERQQGQAARAQLIQAIQITSAQLDKINRKVQGALR